MACSEEGVQVRPRNASTTIPARQAGRWMWTQRDLQPNKPFSSWASYSYNACILNTFISFSSGTAELAQGIWAGALTGSEGWVLSC